MHTDIAKAAGLCEPLVSDAQVNHTHSGFDVVLSAFSTSPGTFTIEESTDSINWQPIVTFDAVPNVTLGLRFCPGMGFYRTSWASNHGAMRVLVVSQLVPPLYRVEAVPLHAAPPAIVPAVLSMSTDLDGLAPVIDQVA